MHLNTWSPIGGTAWRGYEMEPLLLEETSHWGEL